MRIAVIGAGISGLALAHHLAKRAEVVVYEAADRVGGNVRTDEIAGCLVEWGPNGFLDGEPATLELVSELGLDDRLLRSRQEAAIRFIWRAGRLRVLPSSPPRFLRSDCLPLGARLRVLAEPLARRPPDGDESVHDFAVRRLGRGAAEVLVDAMVTGIFAGDPRRLSLRAAFPAIHDLEQTHGSLLRGAIKSGGGRRGVLTSFDEGLEVLVHALAERLDVRLGERLDTLPEGYDRVIVTVPAPRAADLLGGELGALLRRIPTAPVAVVALAFRAPLPVPDAFGFLVPRGQGLRILGTLYDSSIFPGRAPAGQRLFRVLIGGRHDPDVVELGDAELLDVVARDLRRVWGAVPDPVHHHVIRHRVGIPQYELGHRALLAEIDARRPPHLHLAGSSYRGVALNACVKEARDLAAELVGG